jgi:hypothetical protein
MKYIIMLFIDLIPHEVVEKIQYFFSNSAKLLVVKQFFQKWQRLPLLLEEFHKAKSRLGKKTQLVSDVCYGQHGLEEESRAPKSSASSHQIE